MLRKLVVVLASVMLLCMPLAAHALGFGSIKLNSALNEPLNAEIELLSPTPGDLSSLTVRLASPEAFLRVGIERPHFLTDLIFSVEEGRGGRQYIKIITLRPVREPFVNFLLDMSWDNGRMLREYTMLLDPPGRVLRQAAPTLVEAPITAAPERVVRPPTVIPELIQEPIAELAPPVFMQPEPALAPEFDVEPFTGLTAEPVAEPVAELAPELAPVPPAQGVPAPVTAFPEVVAEAEPLTTVVAEADPAYVDPFVDDGTPFPRIRLSQYRETSRIMGEDEYGLTRQNDNLWNIAERMRQGHEGVTVYQVMMALLQSNPDAFVDGNVHRLKVGHVLRIDDPAMLTAMSRQQAANAYIAQTDEWNSYRQAAAERTGQQPIIASEAVRAPAVRAEAAGELTLASPDGDLRAGSGASEEALTNDLVALQDELRQVRSNADTMRTRNRELNQKLTELENELTRLQRSLSVKDDELAALQQMLAKLNAETAASPEAAAPAAPAPVVEAPAVVETPPAPVAQAPALAEPAAAPPVQRAAPMSREEERRLEAETATRQPTAERPQPKGMVDEYLDMAKGIFDSTAGVVGNLLKSMGGGNPLLLYVAAPAVLVLLILMMIVARRRKAAEGNYQESILRGGPSTLSSDKTPSQTDSGESSFLSDFAVSGAGAIQTEDSEVDPLTEADVFMAYGRYEAAEERLQEAIEQEPGRKELKVKLLELYNSTRNAGAFESLAEELYASLGGKAESDPAWKKVVSMGKDLVPANPLFSAAAAGGMAAAAFSMDQGPAVSLSDSQVMDIGLETGVFQTSDFASGGDLDFNLDLDSEPGAPAKAPADDMDFNLGGLGGDLGISLDTPEETTTEDFGMDFNLDMGSTSSSAAAEQTPQADLGGLDFSLDTDEDSTKSMDIGGLDFSLDSDDSNTLSFDMPGSSSGADDDATLALDTGGLDFGSGGGMDLNLDAADTADSEMSFGGDEVGTKLDLAKAYIDMGDPDGARSILDEVMDEGNDSQKQEARQLLQQIA